MLLPKFDESCKANRRHPRGEGRREAASPAAGLHPLKTELLQLCRAVTAGTLDAGKLCDLLANPELLPGRRGRSCSRRSPRRSSGSSRDGAAVAEEDAKAQLVGLIKELLREKVVDDKLLLTRLDGRMPQHPASSTREGVPGAAGARQHEGAVHPAEVQPAARAVGGVLEAGGRLSPFRRRRLAPRPAGRSLQFEVIANIQSLIGYFDLDPNRVLDLVLETLEAMPSRVAHKGLLALFNPKYIPHMLGFKFQQYHKGGRAEPTPLSLYRCNRAADPAGVVKFEQPAAHGAHIGGDPDDPEEGEGDDARRGEEARPGQPLRRRRRQEGREG